MMILVRAVKSQRVKLAQKILDKNDNFFFLFFLFVFFEILSRSDTPKNFNAS